jgi:hypothetical protein
VKNVSDLKKIRSRKILCILQCRRDLTLGQQDGTTVHAARAAGKADFSRTNNSAKYKLELASKFARSDSTRLFSDDCSVPCRQCSGRNSKQKPGMRRALTKGGKMVFINYVLRKKLVQIIKQKWNGPPLRELIFNVNEVFFVLEKQNF